MSRMDALNSNQSPRVLRRMAWLVVSVVGVIGAGLGLRLMGVPQAERSSRR